MAYKPMLYRGKRLGRMQNAEIPVEMLMSNRVSRKALIDALAKRLAVLVGSEEPQIPPQGPFRENPIIPPRVPPRAQPVIPPRVPPRAEPFAPPVEERTYVAPPSAWDWVRQPGFYDEDRSFGNRF